MDLAVHLRVLWRFRFLVAAGLILATLLAFLAMFRVSFDNGVEVSYRQGEEYVSYSTLFVTQPGFPWGALKVPESADPTRFTSLAILYSQLATSDDVRGILLDSGPVDGRLEVAAALDPVNQEPLPLVSIAAFSDSPAKAVDLARRQTAALLQYLTELQETNSISSKNRVEVSVVREAKTAKLSSGRSLTAPVAAFLAAFSLTVALAFVLENLRPRVVARGEREALAPPDAA